MKPKPTQEELQAATNATLRAHVTTDEAKALVARLVELVDSLAERDLICLEYGPYGIDLSRSAGLSKKKPHAGS
jgi:hypothetical protein